jgi:hypothetical protein
MSVDAYLAACGNGTAKRLRGRLVAELLKTVSPELRERVRVQPMQCAASWTWPLALLTTALLTVEEQEALREELAEDPVVEAARAHMEADEASPTDLAYAELVELRAVLAGTLPADDLMPYVERCLRHLDTVTHNV